MKKGLYILFLLFFSFCTVTNAQSTLHAIVFADTNDEKIGKHVEQDFLRMTIEVNTIASAAGMRISKHYFKGSECSKGSLMRVLNGLRTVKDDVIFFYYSGHGVRAANDRTEFPQMCLASHYDGDFVPLHTVLDMLGRLPARLKIVLGDCCNSVGYGVSSKDNAERGVTVLTKGPVNSYSNLFMNYRGTIIASGSQKGENALCVVHQDGSPAGGAFTVSLLGVVQNVASRGLNSNWNEILEATKEVTKDLAKHTPVYRTNLQTSGVQHNAEEPVNHATVQDSDIDIDRIDLLAAIANEGHFTVEERVRMMDKMMKYVFSSQDSKVEVIGRNGTTIVSTEKAKDFMLRLSTTHNLINIVELGGEKDKAGRYKSLKIHEIYKDYK